MFIEDYGEPGRTRTCNPLITSRDAKYLVFQAVSSFRECQEWSYLGVVVIKNVIKFWKEHFPSFGYQFFLLDNC